MRSFARMQLAAVVAALVGVAIPTAPHADSGAWLGIWLAETGQIPGFERSEKQIVSIVNVEGGSPADAAGLLRFDVILQIDDQPVHSMRKVVCLLRAARPGQTLRLAIKRQLEAVTIVATLAKRPEHGMPPSDLDCPALETSFEGEGGREKGSDGRRSLVRQSGLQPGAAMAPG
jgi:membrane-associated protease RseP (regulator of RpoE activity)